MTFRRPSVAALAVALAASCSTELSVQTELDVHHAEAWVQEGEGLLGTLRADGDFTVTELIAIEDVYDRVGVRFDSAADDVQVWGRTGDDAASMGDWRPLSITFTEGLAHNAHVDVPEGGAFVQLRFPREHRLSFVAVSPVLVAAPTDDVADLDTAEDDSALQALAADGIAVSRTEWGARSRTCSSRHTPSRLTIHHTATPNDDSLSMPARMRQIQAFHIDNRGWCDVGYHFLVGQDGRVYQGRYENRVGAHAAGANTNNVGIAFIGDFTSRGPSADMLAAAARIMRAVADEYRFSLDRTRVKGHRGVGTTDTSCPGSALFGQLQGLIDLARQSSSLQPPAPTTPTPTPNPTTGASCSSSTLGRTVPHGARVQVDYAGCGVDRCGWYSCNDGSWQCGDAGAGESFGHGACAPTEPQEPPPAEPPAPTGDEPAVSVTTFPFTDSDDTRTLRRRNWSSYSCDPGTREGGAEKIYEVVLPARGTLAIATDDQPGDDVDVDVHLLRRADPQSCLARDNLGLTRTLDAGIYYVVVDTWSTSTGVHKAGPFMLRVAFTPAQTTTPPPPPSNDDVAGCASGVQCLSGTSQRVSGTTVGGSRRFDRLSCGGLDVSGPEVVYRVVVPEEGFFSARLTSVASGKDVDVHVLTALSEEACASRGDLQAGAFVAAGEVYVVVDTFVPASGEDKAGSFTVELAHTGVSRLAGHGMTTTVARRALTAFDRAFRAGTTNKLTYTIIDFDQRSTNRRLWSVDLATGALLKHLHVSHGSGSGHPTDRALPIRFSNTSGSNMSSLGLSKGAEVYQGSNGRSLRLDGLEAGFNTNMRSRAVVIHKATYATPSFAAQNGYLGRSQGCPAIDPAHSDGLIDIIKDGGLVFSHASDATWLGQSRFLR